jgi:hypothetical protein
MKRVIPLPVIFAISLTIAALLPLYVERTMNRVMFADGRGGKTEWGWRRCSLREFCNTYPHMDREQDPALWLTVDLGLVFVYAAVIAIPAYRLTQPRS